MSKMSRISYIVLSLVVAVALLLGCCGVVQGYDIVPPIPVPSTFPGIRYQPFDNPRPLVRLEIFIDLNCPDSRDQWAILKQVQAHYGANQLDLIVQQMPLPYHRNAYLCTQGMYLIEQSSVSSQVFNYIEESMRMWNVFSTANTVEMTETEVLDVLADMAVRQTGIDKTEFVSNINNYRPKTTGAWKFGARRGVAVTPTFFLNGVELGIGTAAPSYAEWIAYLNTIIL